MADDVQSADADQGAEVTDSGLFPDLDSVAPEIREPLGEYIKKVQGGVDGRFREAAEYKKGWAPYEELGVRDVPPETLQELLSFAQLANDPEQFNSWLTNVATERGLLGGAGDDDELGLGEDDSSKVEERLIEKVSELLNPIQERFDQQDQQKMIDEATAEIDSAFSSLLEEHKNLPDNARDTVEALAYRYSDEPGLSAKEVIEKGFADYQQLIGQAEKGLFAKKDGQPQTPEGPGAASMQDEKITSFGDPRLKAQALERLKQSA